MDTIPEEVINKFFASLDGMHPEDRATLKTCRFVSHQFRRIVHPHAFRVLEITASRKTPEAPFEKYAATLSDPNKSTMATCVKELIIEGGDQEDDPVAGWSRRSSLDWGTLCGIVRPLKALQSVHMWYILWIPTPLTTESEKDQVAQLTTWTKNPLRITMLNVSLDPTQHYHPFLLPPMLLSPIVTQLVVNNSTFLHAELTSNGPPAWSCPNVSLNNPSPDIMKILARVTGLTCLELWGIQGETYASQVASVIQSNRCSMEQLVLDIELDTWDTGHHWAACDLGQCNRLHTLVVSLDGNERGPSLNDEEESDSLFPANHHQLLVALLTDMPRSIKHVRLIFQTMLYILDEDEDETRWKTRIHNLWRHIKDFDWILLGKLLSAPPGLEHITVEVAGAGRSEVWTSANDMEGYIRSRLLEGSTQHGAGLLGQLTFLTSKDSEESLTF